MGSFFSVEQYETAQLENTNKSKKLINILVRGNNFDDIFTKYYLFGNHDQKTPETLIAQDKLKNDSFLEYIICNKPSNIDILDNINKNDLKCKTTNHFITNENGSIVRDSVDYVNFISNVYDDFKPFTELDGFTLKIILAKNCAVFIDIITEFINPDKSGAIFITPACIDIDIIMTNYNIKTLYAALYKLNTLCKIYNIELIIRGFSLNMPISIYNTAHNTHYNINTSYEFSQKIIECSKKNNSMANCILQYGIHKHKNIITNLMINIAELMTIVNKINQYDNITYEMNTINSNILMYITNIIETNANNMLSINTPIATKLMTDTCLLEMYINHQINQFNINDVNIKNIKSVKTIKKYIKYVNKLLKYNMIIFPVHSLFTMLILNETVHPDVDKLYIVNKKNKIQLIDNKLDLNSIEPTKSNQITIQNYKFNCNKYMQIIETMISDSCSGI